MRKGFGPRKKKMSDVIHQCMYEIVRLPEDKHVQGFIPLDKENIYHPLEEVTDIQ